jgi:hypothetical protein
VWRIGKGDPRQDVKWEWQIIHGEQFQGITRGVFLCASECTERHCPMPDFGIGNIGLDAAVAMFTISNNFCYSLVKK